MNFQKQQIGNVELIAMQDTWATVSPTTFFPEVSSEIWEYHKDFLDNSGNMILNMGSWLVRSQGQNILIDTGTGAWPNHMQTQMNPSLPNVMHAVGIQPEEIDIVVFSHFHWDHTGWNTDPADGGKKPVFSGARHIVQQIEWDYWTNDDDLMERARYEKSLKPIEQAGLWEFIEGEHAITTDFVVLPTPGHTPGHCSFIISSNEEKAYVLGDAAHIPLQLSETDWSPAADTDGNIARATRHKLFDRIESENALIASGHFPFPGLGHAKREGGQRTFKPI